MKVVVPCDDSACSLRALEFVVSTLRPAAGRLDILILHVRPRLPYPGAVAVAGQDAADQYYREEGTAALQPARDRLERDGIPYRAEILVGDPAATIASYAQEVGAEQIVMGTHGRGGLGSLLLGSVAQEVIRLAGVPVVLVK